MAKLNIEPLNQRNPLWGNKKLGTSNVTIKTSGCVITALSMLCTYYKHPVTPDELNAKLIAVDGFADLNLMKWEKLHDVFPDISWDGKIDCSKTPAPLDKVDTYINKMMPVVALVDFDLAQSGLQQHFVLIIGKENNDYFINDPWTGETYYFSAKYGDPKVGICGLRLYTGPVVIEEDNYKVVYKGQILATYERNIIDQIDELNKQVNSLKETSAQQMQDNAILQTTLTQQEKDNAEFIATIRLLEKQRDDVKSQLKEVEGWAKDILEVDECTAEQFRALKSYYTGLEEEIERLAIELSNTNSKWSFRKLFGKYYLAVKK